MTVGGASAPHWVVVGRKEKEAKLANRARLEGCPGPHVFQKLEDASTRSTLDIYRCARCHGEVFSSMAFWYDRGLRHGYAFAKRGEAAP